MVEAIKLLNEFRGRVGDNAVVLILLGCISEAFVQASPPSNGVDYRLVAHGLAAVLIFSGIVVAILNIYGGIFRTRPARGLIDGLCAGVLAGILGGLLGYGFHQGDEYKDPFYVRVAFCVLFTTPAGGVLGLLFDLFQPDRAIDWRKYLSVILLAIMVSVALLISVIVYFTPVMHGRGISFIDIELIAEIYLAMSLIMSAVQFKWPVRRCTRAVIIFILAVILLRSTSYLLPVAGYGDDSDPCRRLSCLVYYDEPLGDVLLAVSMALVTTWILVAYALSVGKRVCP